MRPATLRQVTWPARPHNRIMRSQLMLYYDNLDAIQGFDVQGSCCNTRHMSDPNTIVKKRRGRPCIGEFPVFSFRLNPDYLEDVDEWRRDEPGNLSRSQAMRELVLKGLRAAYKERKQAARLAMTEQRSLSFRLYT